MKLRILAVIAAGLTTSAAMGITNINISVQQTNGTNTITVLPGATVDYKIVGTLSDAVNEGLALIALSLDFTGGNLAQANTPAGAISCANPMPAFVEPDGMGNPAGFGGTVIVGSPPCPHPTRACLVQIGGALNTIKNTAAYAPYPLLDPILTGIAQPGGCGPAVIATGTLTAPNTPGQYFLNAFDILANVISDGEDGTVYWAVEQAGPGTTTNLTVNVQACVAAAGTTWESVVSHLPNFEGPDLSGNVALMIPEDLTPGDNTDSPFSEPRSAVSKLVVTFSAAINPATATPAAVSIAGRDVNGNLLNLGGVAIGTNVVAGNTKLEITFTPSLPDYAKYRVTLSGLTTNDACGAAVVTGTQRIFTALRGDAANGGDRRVNATDLGLIRSLVGVNPIDPANVNHVRSDWNDDGRINATDLGGARPLVGEDARTIVDP